MTLSLGHRLALGFPLGFSCRFPLGFSCRFPLSLGGGLTLGFQGCSTFGRRRRLTLGFQGCSTLLLCLLFGCLGCFAFRLRRRFALLFGFVFGFFFLTPFLSLALLFLALTAKFRLSPLFRLPRRSRQFGLALGFRALLATLFLRQTLQFFADRDFVHHLGRNRFNLSLLGMQRIRDIQIQQ